MTNITLEQLHQIMPQSGEKAIRFYPLMNVAMAAFSIDTPARQAAFLAQVAHESGSLRYTREIADGSAYEFRADLGNVVAGDGPRFRGRGGLMLTGRSNYQRFSAAVFGNAKVLTDYPETLREPLGFWLSAAWFWNDKSLNSLADAGFFTLITRRINGGLTGEAERNAFWKVAKSVLMPSAEA